MKGDLIFRSALIEALELAMTYQPVNPVALDLAISMMKAAPAVDAVVVVRCKDCKHSRERNEYERNYLVDGVLICTSPDATDDCWNAVWGDHFCSFGERRDGDAD